MHSSVYRRFKGQNVYVNQQSVAEICSQLSKLRSQWSNSTKEPASQSGEPMGATSPWSDYSACQYACQCVSLWTKTSRLSELGMLAASS